MLGHITLPDDITPYYITKAKMTRLKRRDLAIGGLTVETWLCGPPPEAAPTIVFLHDGLGSAPLWRDFPEIVSARTGCGALVFSRLGYGASTPGLLPRPVDYMEREAEGLLPEIIAAAGLNKFFLLGHSDGGSIALLYAIANPAPGLMGVITLAAHVFCEEITLSSIRLAKAEYEGGGLRNKLKRHHGPNVDNAFLGWSGMWLDPAFANWDFRSELRNITVPVLGIQGDQDEYGSHLQVEAIGGSPMGRALLLCGCGHTPQRDKPAETVDAIAGFVAGAKRATESAS